MSRPAKRPSTTAPERLLSALATGAEELIRGPGWPDGVNTLLAKLGEVTDVSRVWIFQTIEVTDEAIKQDYVFEWAKDKPVAQLGMKCFSMFSSPLNLPEYRAIVEGRKRGELYAVLPRQLEDSWLRQTLWDHQRILAMVTVPIMVEGQWWGTLGLDDCEHESEWTEAEKDLLRTAAALISSSLVRRRLSARLQQFSILKNMTESAAWSFDINTRRAWYTSDLLDDSSQGMVSTDINGMLALLVPEDAEHLRDAFRHSVEKNTPGFRSDVRLAKDEGAKWIEVIGNVMRDESGTPTQISGIAVDIRARKLREARLTQQAETDALAGCFNRHAFEEALESEYGQAVTEREPLSLLVADIDLFKNVNDTYGHPAGDTVIRWVADQMQKLCRRNDMLARIGGEEFALLMPGASMEDAYSAAERIRASIATALAPTDAGQIPITVSIGCATLEYPRHESATSLFHEADRALYAAKRAGRNRVRTAR